MKAELISRATPEGRVLPAATAPYPTPMVRPSGMWCRAMAVTSRTLRRQLVERPSCCFWRMCRWGRRWSRPMRKAAPAMRPQTMGMKCRRPIWEAISAAGCSRPRKMALAPRLTEIQERIPASRDCRMG